MKQAVRVIFLHECKLLYRHKQSWVAPFCFFALILFLFPLAFPSISSEKNQLFSGSVWIATIFANSYSLQTLFLSDLENQSLAQWALSPTPLSLLILAKLAAIWLATQLPLLILTFILSLFVNLDSHTTAVLIISLCLGSPIVMLLCSLSLALTLGLKQQGALLGLMLIPLIIPVFILGINVSELASLHLEITHQLAAMAGICLLSMITLPAVIAFALRISLDH